MITNETRVGGAQADCAGYLEFRTPVLFDVGDSGTQNDLRGGNDEHIFGVQGWNRGQTFPVVRFLVSKAKSTAPLGPGPTSQIEVWMESPGLTGEVNLTP